MRKGFWVFILLAFILVLSVSACQSKVADGTALPGSGGAVSEGSFLGDAVERGGYFLSVLMLEDPATPSELYFPKEGKRLVACKIVVGNIEGERLRVNPLNATLLDAEGHSYAPLMGAREGQIPTVVLDPGERVQGWIAFELPDGATPITFQMSKELFGEPFFQVGVQSPPAGHTPVAPRFERAELPPGGIGEEVVGEGYALTVLELENEAMPAPLYMIEPGQRLVAVKLRIANVSGTTKVASPLYFVLIDHEGYVYPVTMGSVRGQLESADLAPGDEVQGWVGFSVPEDVSVEILKFIPVVTSEGVRVNLTR